MQYDIFISYAHHDNTARGNWIEQFHQKLAADYFGRLGKKLNIFFDREDLRSGNALPNRLQQALRATRLFVPVLSPAYLSSEWCRLEFLHFLEQAGELILDGSCRIVPVQLMPYDRFATDSPTAQQEASRIAAYLRDNGILYADFYKSRLPIRPDEPEFDEKVALFSEDIYDILQKMIPPPAPPTADAIFLGYTASGSKDLREQLLREFIDQREFNGVNYRILPDEAPDAPENPKTLPADALEDFLRRQLQASIFSIHLFDDLEGPKPAAGSDEPLVQMQYRLARENAADNPGFRLFLANASTDECPKSQVEFFNRIEADLKTLPQILVLPSLERTAIAKSLLDHIRLLEEKNDQATPAPPPGTPQTPSVFYIFDYRDKNEPIRQRIQDLIYNQKHDPYPPVFPEDEPRIDPETAFRNFWLACEKAIILLRNGSSPWCNAMKINLIQVAVEKPPPHPMAICVAEPDVLGRIAEVKSHRFRIIDCTQADFEQQIVEFLNPQGHA